MDHFDYQRFADVYNDTQAFPNLTDVVRELGIAYQTVRNRACILRGRAKRGDEVPALVSRARHPVSGRQANDCDPSEREVASASRKHRYKRCCRE